MDLNKRVDHRFALINLERDHFVFYDREGESAPFVVIEKKNQRGYPETTADLMESGAILFSGKNLVSEYLEKIYFKENENMKQKEKTVSVSAEMEQMLLLLEKFGEIAKNLLEKNKFKKQEQKEPDQSQEEQLNNDLLSGESANRQQVPSQASIDPELKSFLEQFYQEFLLVRNAVNEKSDAAQKNQVLEDVSEKPGNLEQATISRYMDALENNLDEIEKHLTEAQSLPDSSQEKLTLLQKIGENLIRFENNRLALLNKIQTFFKTLPNQIELKFTKWMSDRMEGLNNRVTQLQQEINNNRKLKNEQTVEAVEKVSEITKESSGSHDVKASDYPLLMNAMLKDLGNSVDELGKTVNQMQEQVKAEIEKVRVQNEETIKIELSQKEIKNARVTGVQTEIDPKVSSMESIKSQEAAGVMTTASVIDELEEVTLTEYGESMEEAYQNSEDPDPDVAAFPTEEQRVIETEFNYDPENEYEPEY